MKRHLFAAAGPLAVGTLAALCGCAALRGGVSARPGEPFHDDFAGGADEPLSFSRWQVTSGSVHVREGMAWSRSSVLRFVTRRRDFKDFALSLAVRSQGLGTTFATPGEDWDGLHVFLRYQSPQHLYVATLNRRDNKVVIKKKVPGGPSNGGTYYRLSPEAVYHVPYQTWQRFQVLVRDEPDGAVAIEVREGGRLLARGVDNGRAGGPPITAPGRVGVRADNTEFYLDEFRVEALQPELAVAR